LSATYAYLGKNKVNIYIIEWDALHGLVLLDRVHFVEVAISDEQCSVLCFIEAIDLLR